jgi:hypothetical protein
MRLLRRHWPFHWRISIRGCWPISAEMKFNRPWSPSRLTNPISILNIFEKLGKSKYFVEFHH